MFINVSRSDAIDLVCERSMGWRIATYVLAIVVTTFFGVLMAEIPGPPAPKGTVNPPQQRELAAKLGIQQLGFEE